MTFNEYVDVLNSGIDTVKGIGTKKKALFEKMGIYSLWDILYTFPRTYEDRTVFLSIKDIKCDSFCSIKAVIRDNVIEKKLKNNMSLYILRVEDATGTMSVKWFSSPFNKYKLKRGGIYSFYGQIQKNGLANEMLVKEIEPADENTLIGRIIPIYPLTQGISQKDFRNCITSVLTMLEVVYETLPQEVISSENLMALGDALKQIHMPQDKDSLQKARFRFAFEEIFVLMISMRRLRQSLGVKTGVAIDDTKCALDFANRLPFPLTDDQKNVVNDICRDFKNEKPMNRLVQGDVGSGKTAVCALASFVMAKNGYQTALMVPTEILATQHYATFNKFFEGTGINIALITGSTKDKKIVATDVSMGKYDIVIGTHALIQDNVKFNKLGLCITDEQHRFGVKQRAALSKGDNYPHVLVMSATPIPRTLSLILYGDLDISVIKSLPLGRQKVDTFCVNSSMRARLDSFIQKQVDEGHQCFVVCPLIEESEKVNAKSGMEEFQRLSKVFPCLNIGFLHGKMTPTEKDEMMQSFKDKKYDILVSTTVIEVGIDIPNATLIVIENAERFGLSQLHQLRGRVGRGKDKSYCVLVCDTDSEDSKKRMKIMCSSSDGFVIANEDLKLRGCGEFFGTRQHGVPEFKTANLFTDVEALEVADRACNMIMTTDPELDSDKNKSLKMRIEKLFKEFGGIEIFN